MHRRFFPTRRAPPTMEIELARRDIVAEDDQRPQPRLAHPNFRINRIRRPFIYKPADLPEAVSHDIEQIPCRYCHDQILSNHYTQHLVNCPARDDIQQEDDRSEMPVIDLEATPRHLEEPTIESIIMDEDPSPVEEEPIQIQPINFRPNNSLTFTSEEINEDFPNFTEDLEDSTLQPTRHQIRQLPPLEPISRFESDFSDQIANNPIRSSILEDSDATNDPEEEPETNAQTQVAQTEDEVERHPRGAFVVRTIETGPNGNNIVRMRVIPLDTLFGRNQENTGEGGEPGGERTGILGLLSMLATLQGGRAAQIGDFLNLFREERGLDKEVLESLPVVTYTEEGFKNVDEESKKCTICLDQYEEQQEVKFLWCMHRFHKGCVDQWLDKHTTCPFCKKDYSEALRNYE